MPAHETSSSPQPAAHETTLLHHGVSLAPRRSRRATANERNSSTPDRQHVGLEIMATLLTPDEVSRYLGIPQGTLANWRYQGRGPAYVRLGRHVRYRARDVDEWVNGQLARNLG